MDSDAIRLTIVAHDRPGLLADSAAVVSASGLSIARAHAATWAAQRLALHSFVVDGGASLDDDDWQEVGESLRKMVTTGSAPVLPHRSFRPVRVTTHGSADRSLVKVTARNQLGLLSTICRWFERQGINIESVNARSKEEFAQDAFLVVGEVSSSELKSFLEQRSLVSL